MSMFKITAVDATGVVKTIHLAAPDADAARVAGAKKLGRSPHVHMLITPTPAR
jgi:hypothetical protein